MKYRLAVLTSHPIHYQAPLWRLIAADPMFSLTVFFQSSAGLKEYHDPEFGRIIKWDLPLVEGYEHRVLSGTSELLKIIRRSNFDALLVHAWNSPQTWLAVAIANLRGVKVLLRAESPWNQEAMKTGWKLSLKRMALGTFFSGVDAFLYIGEENKRFYTYYGVPKKKLFFVPYAVENSRFFKDAEKLHSKRAEIRAKLGITSDAVVFMSAGKLIQKKRPLDLLRAYAKVSSSNKALVLVGEGELRPELEAYIAKHKLQNVILAGFIGQKDIASYYSIADVFVLPSGSGETWGLVVNEAMCFGLPVIISDMVGSATDLARDNGYVFPLGDFEALARCMQEFLLDPELRKQCGQRSRERVAQYSYEEDVIGIKAAMKHIV